MSILLKNDLILRRVFSLIFRFLLLSYGMYLFINFGTYDNILVFFLLVVLYISIYLFTRKKDRIWSIIRLVNDYLLINYLIYSTDSPKHLLFSLLILPIINSPNHSGRNRSIVVIYILMALSIFHLNQFAWNFDSTATVIVFVLIGIMDIFRSNYIYRTEQLNSKIEGYLNTDFGLNKSYHIYRGLMSNLNSTRFFGFNIDRVLCFRVLKNERIVLVNSSKFVINYSFSRDAYTNLLSISSKNTTSYGIEIQIENQAYVNTLAIVDRSAGDFTFIYLFVSDSLPNFRLLFNYLFVSQLKPVLRKISKIIELENNLQKSKVEFIHQIIEKYYYVINAEKALHFIRNKLSPIKNYLDMMEDFEENNLNDQDLRDIIDSERRKLKVNFDLINSKANIILDKGKNPFFIARTAPFSIKSLLGTLRRIWNCYFDDFEQVVSVDSNIDINTSTIYGNDDGFELVFTDWISNIDKYGTGKRSITLKKTPNNFVLSFANSVSKVLTGEIEQIIADYNSKNKNEILKRRRHGLFNVKLFLEEMSINSDIRFENEIFILNLYLDAAQKKNSDF